MDVFITILGFAFLVGVIAVFYVKEHSNSARLEELYREILDDLDLDEPPPH